MEPVSGVTAGDTLMLGSMVFVGVVGAAEGAADAVGLVWGMVSALLVQAVNSARLIRVTASRIRILFNAVRLLAPIVSRRLGTYFGKNLIKGVDRNTLT